MVSIGSPRFTASPSFTATLVIRPVTGRVTCDTRFGFASILPGETTSSNGTAATVRVLHRVPDVLRLFQQAVFDALQEVARCGVLRPRIAHLGLDGRL